MLIRRAVVALILAAGSGALLAPGPAYADYEHCDALGNCYWVVENPGSEGGGNSGGGNNDGGGAGQGCSYEGQAVPCVVDGLGVWDGVLLRQADLAAARGTDRRLLDHPHLRPLRGHPLRNYGVVAGPTRRHPAVLPGARQRAIAQMNLDGPDIGIAPQTDGPGLVGLPTWLWNRVSPSTGAR